MKFVDNLIPISYKEIINSGTLVATYKDVQFKQTWNGIPAGNRYQWITIDFMNMIIKAGNDKVELHCEISIFCHVIRGKDL